MNFDESTLKIGDVFYQIHEHINTYQKRKEHRVIDGEDWYKYTKPIRTYTITTLKVIGILRKELEGKWDDLSMSRLLTEYFVEYQNESSSKTETDTMDFYDGSVEYYFDKDAALEHINTLDAAARELDRQ